MNETLGDYYSTEIMPAQVRKSKRKLSVKGMIRKIAAVIACLALK
ncbi:hypothetical protein ACFHWD_08995 [Clostridium sp. MT-14]|jgi:hypothetical protein|nr:MULTISPECIES: hypothetical protein [Clostridium]CAB1255289.1 hypothetical protein CLOSBL3_13108 [Clostridiaceae bacterium BL-3]